MYFLEEMALQDITRKWLRSREARTLEAENERIQEVFVRKCFGVREDYVIENIVIATVWYEVGGMMYKKEFICNEEGDFEEINH